MALTKFISCATTDDFPSLLKLLVKVGDCDTNYIDCDNQYENWITLLKQLILTDDEGNLYLSVCGANEFTSIIIGDGTDGSWRWIRDGANNLMKQKRKAGVWVTVDSDIF